MTEIRLPQLSLVLLVGPSGAGKSTFAAKHFLPTEVVSSDRCRALVSDDANDQKATKDAFDLLHHLVGIRLRRGLLTVVDATNVQPAARKSLVALAREHHVLPVAIVLDISAKVCGARNALRPDRSFGPHVVRQQRAVLRKSMRRLKREGFRRVAVLDSPDAVDAATIVRQPLWNDLRGDHGPFDVIGDVHGCQEELSALLAELGYARSATTGAHAHPDGRRVVFVGDLVDRGPDSPGVLEIVMDMVERGSALCVPGNHEVKLLRKLSGRNVKLTHGLAETMAQLAQRDDAFVARVRGFIDKLVSHYVFDDGRLVVAHAGLTERLHGRASGAVRAFALYGETTGETDAFGLPVRYDWAREYRGDALVVYGHTPVVRAEWCNNTICIDTGCVFGGSLTALRYPERELIAVPSARVYYEPTRPLAESAGTAGADDKGTLRPAQTLDITDVSGKRILHTRYDHTVTVREDHAAAALEVMSRFAVDPRWLIYLPPTMSPTAASRREGRLEHPDEAFSYYREQNVARVICQEKHMGSRAVIVVARDPDAAQRRFAIGAAEGRAGVIYTRTGRPFFSDPATESALLARVVAAVTDAGLWATLRTDWLCLDVEIMPWSAKAHGLIREQYAPVAAAGLAGLAASLRSLDPLAAQDESAAEIRDHMATRLQHLEAYSHAYEPYCWPVTSLDDYAIAPFHLLASEGHVHTDKDHEWHMRMLGQICAADADLFRQTAYRVVEPASEPGVADATTWWEALVDGGEGMVVKPLSWIAQGPRGMVQPALKCRGPEYLRMIYGPEYLEEERLAKLRHRHLGTKRRLARKEFSLGLEALQRFVDREPLHRVHECVFGVLALESEPVDPRL